MSQTASRSAGASGRSSSRSVAMGSAGRNMRRIYPSGMTRTGGRLGTFPPAPQPLRVPVPDSHTHLDITLSEGGGGGPRTVKEAIELAAAAGVDRLVQVGTEVGSSRWSADLAEEHRAVLATVALHPNEAPRLSDLDGALREIESVAGRDRVRAVGETGLDFFRTPEPGRPTQEASFRAHFAIACAKRGYVLSFAGTVTFAIAGALREAARVTPLDQILVETDAPYLTPMPHRGRPNASYLIPLTVRALAETKGVEVDELCAAISATGERIFGPW